MTLANRMCVHILWLLGNDFFQRDEDQLTSAARAHCTALQPMRVNKMDDFLKIFDQFLDIRQ